MNRVGALVNLTLSFEKEIGNIESETVTTVLPTINAQNQPTGQSIIMNFLSLQLLSLSVIYPFLFLTVIKISSCSRLYPNGAPTFLKLT